MDEKLGTTPKVACKELAQWMKTCMKMDETSLFDHFKMFLHKFKLGISRRWLKKKKSTN
jgi:hypothetical protein